MPEMDGFRAGEEIRKTYGAPILFLTAYSGETDKIRGFSLGADDYIVKPFSNMELIMRIRAVFRRIGGAGKGEGKTGEAGENAEPAGIRIGDLLLDPERQSVRRGMEEIPLTGTEYRILELLASHRKKIYSLDNIYQSVWEEDAVGDGTIMVHIKNIRKKLNDSSRSPRYIKTAWGKGYYVD